MECYNEIKRIEISRTHELLGKVLHYSVRNNSAANCNETLTSLDLTIERISLMVDDYGSRVVEFFGQTDTPEDHPDGLPLRCALEGFAALLDSATYVRPFYDKVNSNHCIEVYTLVRKGTYRIELNDFVSKEDECVTSLGKKVFGDPEKAAKGAWDIANSLCAIHDAKLENQGDQFMVFFEEGTYNPQESDGVLYTLRVLDENNEPYDL